MTCDRCKALVYKTRFVGGEFIGVDCGCVAADRVQRSCVNVYGDLVLDHVHDESGNKVRITSSRQLAEAEVRFNFSSCVRNMEAKNFDAPPQARRQGIGETYQRKFSRRG